MKMRTIVAAAALGAVAVLGACQPEPDPVGELVGTWQEGTDTWVRAPMETELLTSEGAVEQWVWLHARTADDETMADLLEVDMSENAVVVVGYSRCMEYSRVVPDGDDAVRVEVVVDPEDEDTLCGWSPFTIDAWAVPLDATGGVAPQLWHGEEQVSEGGTTGAVGWLLEPGWTGDVDGDLGAVVDEHGGLLGSEEERDAFADALDATSDEPGSTQRLRQIDMSESWLAVVGYRECPDYSQVVVDPDDPNALEARIRTVADTACSESPYVVDVWVIDRDDVGDTPVLTMP